MIVGFLILVTLETLSVTFDRPFTRRGGGITQRKTVPLCSMQIATLWLNASRGQTWG